MWRARRRQGGWVGLMGLGLMMNVLAQSQPLSIVPVNTGQSFVNCVQTWLQSGGNVTCALSPAKIDMANTTYVQANPAAPMPAGDLTLTTAGPPTLASQKPSILDCAMQSGLTPAWNQTASHLNWVNLVLTNLCTEWLTWNIAVNYYILSSSNTFLFERARSIFTQTRVNITMYVPYSELLSMTYWNAIMYTPFQAVQESSRQLLGRTIDTQSIITENTMYSITLARMYLPGGPDFNVTYRATNNPQDPLRLASLGGPLMAHQFCNGRNASGTLLTVANLGRNMTVFPLWISDNTTLMKDVSDMTAALLDIKSAAMPFLLLVNNATLAAVGQTGGFVIRSNMLIQGPMNVAKKVSLSLSNYPSLLFTTTEATLFLFKLILTGLVSQEIAKGYTSALPLWGLNQVSTSGPTRISIQASNVTLVLPQNDYAALYSAAVRGPAWQSAAVATAPLISGISNFVPASPGPPASPIQPSLALAAYTGWGMNGTNIIVIPDTPLPPNFALPDPYMPPSPNTDSNSSGRGTALGVGIGVGVGGTLVLVGLTLLIYILVQRRKKAKYAGAGDVETNGKPQAPGAVDLTAAPASAYPPRELIHKAVSQAQEAMKGSDCGSVALGSCQSSTRHDGNSSDTIEPMAGTPALATPGTFKNGAIGRVLAVDAASPRASSSTPGGTPVNGLSTPADAPSSAVTPGGVDSRMTQSAPRSSDSSRTMDPLKAVQARAGQIQKSDADKLTLLSVLGRGAWGTVYKGTWRGLTVAVKTVLFSEREDGDTTLPHERAIMEAAVCTSVAHRNVVATYHYDIKPVRMVNTTGDEGLQVEAADDPQALGITDWKLFLVQEWCNSTLGQALRSWLLHKKATREPLIDLLLELLLDVAQGINYLHDKNIIHGDLKPENVMLKTDSSAQIGVVAKITDFGLSTTLAPTATHVSNYKSGTPFYVAPEVTAQGRTTKASDTYSMGVLMWEAYCCMPPWIKVGSEYQANNKFPVFPPACPPPYIKLAKSCLSIDAKQRPSFPAIVTSLRAMLDAWQQGYDSLELPPGVHVTNGLGRQPSAHPPISNSGAGTASSAGTTCANTPAQQASPQPTISAPPPPAKAGEAAQPAEAEKAAHGGTAADSGAALDRGTSGTLLSEWVRQANPNDKPPEAR